MNFNFANLGHILCHYACFYTSNLINPQQKATTQSHCELVSIIDAG